MNYDELEECDSYGDEEEIFQHYTPKLSTLGQLKQQKTVGHTELQPIKRVAVTSISPLEEALTVVSYRPTGRDSICTLERE